MNENLNKLNFFELQEFLDVFEKTLIEISILDSLQGNSNISDYVKDIFQASIKDLLDFGTLKTLVALIEDNKPKQKEEKHNLLQSIELSPMSWNNEQLVEKCIPLETKIQIFKQKEEEIDSITEKLTEDGEHALIRKDTEKTYAVKWEKARVENFKLKFKADELELENEISKLQVKLETEKIVDAENEKFLNYSINEFKRQINYWECKYRTDIMDIDGQLKNLMRTLKNKNEEVENLKITYNKRQHIIEDHVKNKQKMEYEKKINDYREKMATKIQAWWKGNMVRRHLGPYKNLLGSRKKSIKKPPTNKAKKMKSK